MNFEEIAVVVNEWITPSLEAVFSNKDDVTVQASEYSLMAGGKRFRPCLMYFSSKMLNINPESVKIYACALEMIHTYSLIHDDLPAMDNDDLRRGKPTCHKVFGEGIAILAGDNLLNKAYELLFNDLLVNPTHAEAASEIARLAGIEGMIGGQSIDIDSEGKSISLELLKELQNKKTGALIEAAVMTPYYLSGINNSDIKCNLKALAAHIGLAFQISDDILDVLSDEETLGKSIGKDERDCKPTFVTLLGLEQARDSLNKEISDSLSILDWFDDKGYDTSSYRVLVNFMNERMY